MSTIYGRLGLFILKKNGIYCSNFFFVMPRHCLGLTVDLAAPGSSNAGLADGLGLIVVTHPLG